MLLPDLSLEELLNGSSIEGVANPHIVNHANEIAGSARRSLRTNFEGRLTG